MPHRAVRMHSRFVTVAMMITSVVTLRCAERCDPRGDKLRAGSQSGQRFLSCLSQPVVVAEPTTAPFLPAAGYRLMVSNPNVL